MNDDYIRALAALMVYVIKTGQYSKYINAAVDQLDKTISVPYGFVGELSTENVSLKDNQGRGIRTYDIRIGEKTTTFDVTYDYNTPYRVKVTVEAGSDYFRGAHYNGTYELRGSVESDIVRVEDAANQSAESVYRIRIS